MAGKISNKGINRYVVAMREKKYIEKKYDFFQCKIVNHQTLKCVGKIQPTKYSITYKIVIKYTPPTKPQVNIINPIIEYNDDIHMYYDTNSLCLYYLKDMRWTVNYYIYNTIIPWTAEWLVFYELYQISGKWEHPYVPHKKIKNG